MTALFAVPEGTRRYSLMSALLQLAANDIDVFDKQIWPKICLW